MSNEEKILELLTKMQADQTEIREEQKQIREEQKQMRKEQMKMREEQMKMREEQMKMREEQKQMQEDIAGIKLRLDYDVNKRFDAINDGIDSILEQLVPKSRVDALEDDVIVLKTAVKMLTQEVAELKKAQ